MAKDLNNILSKIDKIPTLPQLATRLMALLDNPETSARDIREIMVKDPGLAGRILKLTNTAYYGATEKVVDLNQAIVILGFKTIRSIALSACVLDIFPESDNEDGFEILDFWKHSFIAAAVCKGVALRRQDIDEEEAFVVGLLHDIGKIALKTYAPEETRQILTLSKEKQISFYAAEEEILETNHAEIGGWLIEKWGLPDHITNTIATHHELEKVEDQLLGSACRFANYICTVKGFPAPGNYESAKLDKAVWDKLGLERNSLPKIIEYVNKELAAAEDLLQIVNPVA